VGEEAEDVTPERFPCACGIPHCGTEIVTAHDLGGFTPGGLPLCAEHAMHAATHPTKGRGTVTITTGGRTP
jgi:hypothetical protein